MFNGSTVLVADDNEINRSFLEQTLKRQRANVLLCADGKEAIETAERHPSLDLIIMDLRMPELSGIEALREIRKMPPHKNTPSIMLTADIRKEHARDYQEDYFLADIWELKPIEQQKLLEVISKLAPAMVKGSKKAVSEMIDMEHALNASGGDAITVKELLKMLRDIFPGKLREIQEQEKTGDLHALKENFHGMQGSLGFCGALSLQQQCIKIEGLIEQDQKSELKQHLSNFYKNAEKLIEELKAF